MLILLSALLSSSATFASTCDVVLTERRAELERLAAPRPITWGFAGSVKTPYRKILPAGSLVMSPRNVDVGSGRSIEEITFLLRHSNWAMNKAVLRVDRRAADGPRTFDFACRAPKCPVHLTVERVPEGYVARVSAIEGGTLRQLFGGASRVRLLLTLTYDASARFTGVDIDRLDSDDALLDRISLVPAALE